MRENGITYIGEVMKDRVQVAQMRRRKDERAEEKTRGGGGGGGEGKESLNPRMRGRDVIKE